MKEIKDIAQWEETDSELAKYTIQQLNGDNMHLKTYLKNIEQVNKDLYERIDKVLDFINAWKDNKTDLKVSMLDLLQIEDILRGE